MANYGYLILISVVFFCLGLFLIVRGVFGVDRSLLIIDLEKISYKNNFPIIPRNHRNLIGVLNVSQKSLQSNDDDDEVFESTDLNTKLDVLRSVEPVDLKSLEVAKEQAILVENQDVERAKIADDLSNLNNIFNIDIPPTYHSEKFYGETSMLDGYFRKQRQETTENNQVLFNQKQTLTVIITPRNGEGVLGTQIITIARDYGMKHGVLNMFHRYENPEGTGMLWFSMLGVSNDGIKNFDLLDLPQATYRGLVLFLSLPHPQALRGFDSMVQVAQTIAHELDADIHDESDYIIDAKKFAQLRNYVADYKG